MNWAPLLLLALLGAAPAPLVVGSIRDQHGAPIAGAEVTLVGTGDTATAADGTFSLPGSGTAVLVRCAYCRPAELAVPADGVVVGIVQRYDAVSGSVPSADDLAHLPYARVESELSLAPFVVLNQSRAALPGATLDDRNAFPQGGLVLLNGVADYDIVAGATPFDTVPAYGATSISVARVDEAYNYGDIAHAGTFGVTTSGGADSAFFGADSGAHASTALGEFGASAAFSNWNQGDRRSHIDLTGPISSESTQGDFEISSGEGMLDTDGTAALASSFSSARASIERTTGPDMFASASIDRGTYTYQSSYAPDTAVWADEDLSAGVRSRAALAPFALIDIRESAGSYWESSAGTIAATLGQARAIAGLSVAQPGYDAQFAIGNDDATYTGGYPGALVDNGSTATALGSFDLKFDPQWTLHASAAHGYVVQTFLGTFGAQAPAIPSVFDVVATSEATLEFDSLARVRASLTTLRSQDASGSASSSAGASLGWQVAPVLSLRTWLLETQSSTIGPRTVGSAWLTYTTPGLRVDAIWRRDLLDTQPDAHLDGSIGGPLGPRLGWFVSTERRNGTRATDVGIRF